VIVLSKIGGGGGNRTRVQSASVKRTTYLVPLYSYLTLTKGQVGQGKPFWNPYQTQRLRNDRVFALYDACSQAGQRTWADVAAFIYIMQPERILYMQDVFFSWSD